MKPIAMVIAASAAFFLVGAGHDPSQRPPYGVNLFVPFNCGDAADLSPYNATPTLAGNAVVTAGNRYVTLDGNADYVNVPNNASLDVTSAFTISLWAEPSSPGSSVRQFYARWLPLSKRSIQFGADYINGVYFIFIDRTGTQALTTAQLVYYFSATIPTSGWHHFAIVYDNSLGAGNRAKMYVDGVEIATSSQLNDTSATPLVTDVAAQIAGFSSATNWKGSLDDFRLYGMALSSAEVAQLYSAGHP